MEKENDFITEFKLGWDEDYHFHVVPVKLIKHPLYVYRNYGSADNEYFCSLPRNKWCRYFGDKNTLKIYK